MRWEGPGLNSCAHWLNWKCGIGLGAAREQVRVAHALKKLPKISDKFKTGELSYSKVRAMSRIATPENEDYLLIIARHSTAAHIERLVSSNRGVLNRQKAVSAEENREVTWYHDDDGSVVIRARFPAEAGEGVIKALELAEATMNKHCEAETSESVSESALDSAETPSPSPSPTGTGTFVAPEPFCVRHADALMDIAAAYLKNPDHATSGADRYLVTLHVNADALIDVGSESDTLDPWFNDPWFNDPWFNDEGPETTNDKTTTNNAPACSCSVDRSSLKSQAHL